MRSALLATDIVPSGPGQTWPPLQRWLERIREPGGLPQPPDIDACRRRLRPGEALVQIFPDLASGRLWALWLTCGRPVELRAFPAAADWSAWQAPAGAPSGVLDRWSEWVAGNELVNRFAPLWDALATDGALPCAAGTLAGWARADGVGRLVVLLPAPLAQLPWEALAAFAEEGAPTLERAVNLSHWRTSAAGAEPTPSPAAAWVAYDDADPRRSGPCVAAEACEAAQRHATEPHRSCAHGADAAGLSAFDLLTLLHGTGPGHLIVHGRFDSDEPRRSRLELAAGERLYAWTFAALGIGSSELVLSACQANVCGRATRDRLGPIGLGPALIAGGARCVLGPLWSCDQVASWMFHRCVHAARAAAPQASWPQWLADARRRLQAMSAAGLEEELEKALGSDVLWRVRNELDHLLLVEQPFASPYYWAAFVLIGDPAAAVTAP